MFRDGLAAMLGDRPGGEVVAAVATGREAVTACVQEEPDIAVVDLGLPDGDGIWVIGELQRRCPSTRVLVLTSAEDERSVGEALRAGAHGYLLKTAAPGEIADAVTAVAGGTSVVSDDVLAAVTRRLADSPRRGSRPLPHLTDREYEVLEELAQGRGTDDIARRLGLSAKTVRNHISNVMLKLGVADRAAAVVAAQAHGVGVSEP